MKDKIEQWVLPRINAIMSSLEFEECSGYVNTFSGIVSDCLTDLQPQWVSVDDRLPIIRTDGSHVQVSVLATDGDNVCQINFRSGCTPTDWYEWSEYGDIEPALITHWKPLPLPPSEGE